MKCIAGIGSRKTSTWALHMMKLIGEWCLEKGIWVRSGHAEGADYAFERGAKQNTIVYLPWAGFNSKDPLCTRNVMTYDEVSTHIRSMAKQSVYDFHPAPNNLNAGGFKCMARNYFQIFGTKEVPRNVDCVVCWTPKGKGTGGTGQAIRIANHYHIPVIDLGLEEHGGVLFTNFDVVIGRLEAILGL